MTIKDRIVELRRVPAKTLIPNPKNWRTHPEKQKNVLKGVLAEIGYADALLARELEDGSLQLIDGHLRAETTPEQEVPVLILDLNASEADKLLALLDPLTTLAETNRGLLAELVADLETKNTSIQNMIDEMISADPGNRIRQDDSIKDLKIPEIFQIVVECQNEEEQRELFERMVAEGRTCRILNL